MPVAVASSLLLQFSFNHADDFVSVRADTWADATSDMAFFAERMKLVVEPTGCLAAAAAFSGAVPVAGKRVGVVISGGNVDLASFARFIA